MKDIDEAISDRIDNYLLDRLSEAEHDAFEAEMLGSPDIQQELVFRSTVSNALWVRSHVPNEQREQPEMAEKSIGDKNWWSAPATTWTGLSVLAKWLTAATALAILGILAFLWSGQPNESQQEPATVVSRDSTSSAVISVLDGSLVQGDTPATPSIPPQPKKKTKSVRVPPASISALQTDPAEEAWDAAMRSGAWEAYRAFVQNYPQSPHRSVAEQAIQQQCLPTPDHLLPAPVQKLQVDMLRVEGGAFIMGCQDKETEDTCAAAQKPEHLVRVPAFSIGRYEVTQAQWRSVIGSDPPRSANRGCDDCPVEHVSWIQVQDFISKLNTLTNRNYRLPSEAEWEFAARGGARSKGYRYSGSDDLSQVAWTGKYTQKATQPVGTKTPNELGLYDMSGNVHEWVMDCYNENYDGAPIDGKAWLAKGNCELRVARGGSWNPKDPANYCRSAFRLYFPASTAIPVVGFRLASD